MKDIIKLPLIDEKEKSQEKPEGLDEIYKKANAYGPGKFVNVETNGRK